MKVKLRNGIIEVDVSDRNKFLQDISKAILDGELSVVKIVGFAVGNASATIRATVLERCENCLQSLPELANRLGALTFKAIPQNVASANFDRGTITTKNIPLFAGGQLLKTIGGNAELMQIMGPTRITVVLRLGHGYFSLDDNFRYLRSVLSSRQADVTEFFPLQSEHNILDLFRPRALPDKDGTLRYTMNPEADLTGIEEILNDYVESKGLL
jgi:hypothetical protein